MKKSWRFGLSATVLLLAIIGIQIALFMIFRQPEKIIPTTDDCDIRRHCVLPNDAMVQAVGTISAKTPFRLYIHHVPEHTQKVYVEFSMRDMDMGFNRYTLIKDNREPNTRFAAQIRLPVCVTARRDYIMTVYFDKQAFNIPFISD